MIYLMNIITQACTVTALILTYLANEWLTVGYGINPWIALPVATILMGLPHFINHYMEEIPQREDLTCIKLKTLTQR